MDFAHLHMLINHLPLFGSLFALLVLLFGRWSANLETQKLALYLFILSAVGVVIAFYTGEPAEHLIKQLEGISKKQIHEHEEAADWAFASLSVVGVLCMFALFIQLKNTKLYNRLIWIIMILGLWSLSIIAKTAYEGGKIRHTEFQMELPIIIHEGDSK